MKVHDTIVTIIQIQAQLHRPIVITGACSTRWARGRVVVGSASARASRQLGLGLRATHATSIQSLSECALLSFRST